MAQSKDVRMGTWPRGVDQVEDHRELQWRRYDEGGAALRAAVNVDITRAGKLRRRRGYTAVSEGFAHSLWSSDSLGFGLLVKDGQLQRLDSDATLTALGAVHPVRPMAYAEVAGRIYLSNGVGQWIYEDQALRAWGVDAPGAPIATAAGVGDMDAGTYKVNATAFDALGEESGCGESSVVTVTAGGGILLEGLPTTGTWTQIYVTAANGDVLYASKRLPAGIPSYVLTRADLQLGKALETQFADRIPPAAILCAYRGRIYFAIGSRLFYTLPLRYGLFRRHEGYLPMPHDITGAVATNETLFVGTERATYSLLGDDPKTMQRKDIDGFGMVPGTATRLVRGDSVSACWWSKDGVLYRANEQGVAPLTRNRLALPSFQAGAILLREADGFSQLVSSLKGAGPSNTFAARDRYTAKVVRNGVVIN